MDKTDWSLRLVAGVTLLLVCGCHSPYSYQPYGYYGAPGTYAPQMQIPGYPGAFPATPAAPAIPGGYPAGIQQLPPVYQGYPGATTLPAQPLGGTTVPGTIEGTPMYSPGVGVDPTWEPVGGDTLGPGGSLGDPSTFDGGSIDPVPRPQDPYDNPMFNDELGSSEGTDAFGFNDPRDEEKFARPVSASAKPVAPVAPVAQGRAESDFDSNYRWLKGVLHREAGNWYVVYAIGGTNKAGVADKYGGDLKLARTGLDLTQLSGKPVEVIGQVVTGEDGGPLYKVTDIHPLRVREL